MKVKLDISTDLFSLSSKHDIQNLSEEGFTVDIQKKRAYKFIDTEKEFYKGDIIRIGHESFVVGYKEFNLRDNYTHYSLHKKII